MSVFQRGLPEFSGGKHRVESADCTINPEVLDRTKVHACDLVLAENPWLTEQELVAKPSTYQTLRQSRSVVREDRCWRVQEVDLRTHVAR